MECMMVWCPDRETGIGSSKLDMGVTENELISTVTLLIFILIMQPRLEN